MKQTRLGGDSMRDEILESLEWFEVMQCPEAFNCIYVWRNKVNGKTYVGKAVKLHKRRREHLRAKEDYYFYKSLRKRGAEGYQLAIIVKDVPTEELGDIETYYIKVLDSLSKNGKGYNDALGGNGGNTYAGKSPEEMREISKKQSEAHKGENNHKCRKVICITNGEIFGYIKQAEEKYEITGVSINCRGEGNSAGVVDGKPAIWMYLEDYEKLSKEEVNKIKNQEVPNEGRPKAVICLNTEVIYESIREAERQTGVDHRSISACCRGKQKTAGKDENGNKLEWKYLDEYLEGLK